MNNEKLVQVDMRLLQAIAEYLSTQPIREAMPIYMPLVQVLKANEQQAPQD